MAEQREKEPIWVPILGWTTIVLSTVLFFSVGSYIIGLMWRMFKWGAGIDG